MELAAPALYDGTAQSQVDEAGANAAVFDMKSDEGALAYISQLELALDAKVSASDGAINAAIQLLNTGELYTVARISCFRDNTVPRSNMPMAVKTTAGNWRDKGNYRWLSPANPEARAYVIGVCVELAGLGFDLFKLQGRLDSPYVFFFDFLHYALEPELAFPTMYPIFSYTIQQYLKNKRHKS